MSQPRRCSRKKESTTRDRQSTYIPSRCAAPPLAVLETGRARRKHTRGRPGRTASARQYRSRARRAEGFWVHDEISRRMDGAGHATQRTPARHQPQSGRNRRCTLRVYCPQRPSRGLSAFRCTTLSAGARRTYVGTAIVLRSAQICRRRLCDGASLVPPSHKGQGSERSGDRC